MQQHIQEDMCFSFDQIKSEGSSKLRWHGPQITLLFVLKGTISVSTGQKREEVREQQCGLFVENEALEISSSTLAGRIGDVIIQRVTIAGRHKTEDLCHTTPIDASDYLRTLLRLGLKLRNATSEHHCQLRNTLGKATLEAFIACSNHRPQAMPEAAQRARAYIDRHFCEPCDLAQIAKASGISKERIANAFRRHLKISPMRYLWEKRTRKAVHLVQSTNLKLSDIAAECGYKCQFHLSREIKALTGNTPRELRREMLTPDVESEDA